ncbi:MAG TPA: KH domain-containing protein [Candidatus Paceibacterota bacterium]
MTDATMKPDEQFLRAMVEAMVDKPEKVQVERTVDDNGVLLKLLVDPADMGKVLGKKGAHVDAMRVLLHVVGAKHHARVSLKIPEPEGGKKSLSSIDAAIDELKS